MLSCSRYQSHSAIKTCRCHIGSLAADNTYWMTALRIEAIMTQWTLTNGGWKSPEGYYYRIYPFTISPETAKSWLHGESGQKQNKNFRGPVESAIARYARDMESGRWRFNGETIVFDEQGFVRDGQQRLEACIRSGKSFDAIVVEGIKPDVDLTQDGGVRRSFAQYLRRDNYENTVLLSSALTWVWRIKVGHEMGRVSPTREELSAIFKENPSIVRSAHILAGHRMPIGFLSSGIAAIHCIASKRSEQDADRFIELIRTGVGLCENDPILLLRQRLSLRRKEKLPREEIMALIIIAWNKWIAGEPVRQLKWASIGPMAQPFPKII